MLLKWILKGKKNGTKSVGFPSDNLMLTTLNREIGARKHASSIIAWLFLATWATAAGQIFIKHFS